LTHRLSVSKYVKNTFFKIDEVIVIYHPFLGKTYKLDGIGLKIFECLYSRPQTASEVVNALSPQLASIEHEQIRPLLKQLKSLELIQ